MSERYVPEGANPRSVGVLAETARRLGYDLGDLR